MDRGAWRAAVHGVAKRQAQPSACTRYSIAYCATSSSSIPVDGRLSLGCFRVFSVVNSAAVNIGVCVCFQISFLWINAPE